jgi:serine/threonine-protein kinase HipA
MSAHPLKQRALICLGATARLAGELTFVRDGQREYSIFAYDRSWLVDAERFEISPDLPLRDGHVSRRAPNSEDSPFPCAIADTEPDAWGKRVISRAHAKRRQVHRSLGPLTRFDYLVAVDDFSRLGAIRLRDTKGQYLGSGEAFRTPPMIDLARIYRATRAVETGTDTSADLAYLQGKATSLGGLRPKCTVLEEDGTLAIGKFPSVGDMRSVVRGEILALVLAQRAKLESVSARLVLVDGTPVAVIRRFDRTAAGERIPYLSAGSLLQARREEDRAYTDLADALRSVSAKPADDVALLWRRLVFNLLITNVDDHLWNMGVLYAGNGQWRLAPAFDLNPFPDRLRESKTWLSEDTGPITSLEQLLEASNYFGLGREEAEHAAVDIARIISGWRDVATSEEVGMQGHELEAFEAAFSPR